MNLNWTWFGFIWIESDWFSSDLYRTRFKTFFVLIQNASKTDFDKVWIHPYWISFRIFCQGFQGIITRIKIWFEKTNTLKTVKSVFKLLQYISPRTSNYLSYSLNLNQSNFHWLNQLFAFSLIHQWKNIFHCQIS